jgi:transposase
MGGPNLLNHSTLSGSFFVGVDVAKDSVEVCVVASDKTIVERKRLARSSAALEDYARRLNELGVEALVLEASGGLERLPAAVFGAAGVAVSIKNPAQARHYALAGGHLEKSDRVDALVLAKWAAEARPQPTPLPDAATAELAQVLRRRTQLVGLRAIERTRLRGELEAFCRRSVEQAIAALSGLIEQLEAEIKRRLQACEQLARREMLLRTAPGVGPRTAWTLLALLPELGGGRGRPMAKLAGVAPLLCQSGKWRGRVKIQGGRAAVRKALYMAALAAIRSNAAFGGFYERLRARGKAPKAAQIAVARKLLVTLDAMLARNVAFDPAHALSSRA